MQKWICLQELRERLVQNLSSCMLNMLQVAMVITIAPLTLRWTTTTPAEIISLSLSLLGKLRLREIIWILRL